ncbi:hypothetical protein F4820DRAFT_432081 [Hypoxylon rubiginosum]|uniref:Uncharacterized protein n=1 Tax=Hypoxylon rubiginosum TaxID=110542 RepID=A0ACB9YSE1_9PEZI|nr:hypothetical protein F4820DRAFT_432081 [Hypoxylon rubiginosum]
MEDDSRDSEEFTSGIPNLPPELWHSTKRGIEPPQIEKFGIDLTTPSRQWEKWLVKLTFEKSGDERHGNGFFVNVPNADFDIILTAGHNLVDKPQHYCKNIKIISSAAEILVTPDMVRVCERYFNEPEDTNAIYDYGAILLKRLKKDRVRGFGFNLMLGLAPIREASGSSNKNTRDILQGASLYVSGYRPADSPIENPPERSEGRCIRPSRHDLTYEAETIQGMSGGPVWLGFRGIETVVAIHNYGEEKKGRGNRGSRLNLNVWRTIFDWVKVGWYGKSLHYRGSPTYSMHLHIRRSQIPAEIAGEGRVRVGKPGRVDTLFDILPVAVPPKVTESDAGFGFRLRLAGTEAEDDTTPIWVKWNPKQNEVSITRHLDARCEVKLQQIITPVGRQPKPFMIKAKDGDSFKVVQMAMNGLDEGDLELLDDDPQSFEDTSEVSFVPTTKDKFGK